MQSSIAKRAVTEVEPDYIRALMDLTLNHNVGSTMLGALGGVTGEALRGFVSSREKKKRNRRPATPWSLIRSGVGGAGLGFISARAFPVQSSKLNRAVFENLLLKPVGRVTSNLNHHFGYTNSNSINSSDRDKVQELYDIIREQPMEALKAVVQDKPLFPYPEGDNATEERRAAVRHIFALPADYSLFDKNENGTYSLKGRSKDMLQNALTSALAKNHTFGPKPISNSVLGNVTMIPSADGSSYSYRDRWDFDLNRGERVDNSTNFLRHLVSRLTKPMVFEGTVETSKL